MKNTKAEILEYLSDIEVIDTHEHLPPFEKYCVFDADVISEYLSHYFSRDLASAGLPEKDLALLKIPGSMSVKEKWDLIKPYYDSCKYTGYGRNIRICAKDLYGIDDINEDTIEELDKRFKAAMKESRYKKILKEKCNIKTSILDHHFEGPFEADSEYFTMVHNLDYILCPTTYAELKRIEDEAGIKITCLCDYIEAVDKIIAKAFEKCCALKIAACYLRSTEFARTTFAKAEEAFIRMTDQEINYTDEGYVDGHPKALRKENDFTDYILRYILNLCQKKAFPVQVHTGMQEGRLHMLKYSRPDNLNKLFIDYPDVRFDLFHMGYPFQHVTAALVKMFPNVYVDMSWSHIVSPEVCQRELKEWIASIPVNKINGFGGDFIFIDGVYGHLKIAKDNIATSLASCVEDGLFDTKEAKRIAKMFLYDNPKNIFDIK